MPVAQAEEPKRRAAKVAKLLAAEYPDATCALQFSNPLELLIATILSAQCTDVRVNMVTPALFKKYRNRRGLRRRQTAGVGKGDSKHRLLSQQGQKHSGMLPPVGR